MGLIGNKIIGTAVAAIANNLVGRKHHKKADSSHWISPGRCTALDAIAGYYALCLGFSLNPPARWEADRICGHRNTLLALSCAI